MIQSSGSIVEWTKCDLLTKFGDEKIVSSGEISYRSDFGIYPVGSRIGTAILVWNSRTVCGDQKRLIFGNIVALIWNQRYGIGLVKFWKQYGYAFIIWNLHDDTCQFIHWTYGAIRNAYGTMEECVHEDS